MELLTDRELDSHLHIALLVVKEAAKCYDPIFCPAVPLGRTTFRSYAGICFNVELALQFTEVGQFKQRLSDLMEGWPDRFDSYAYPVDGYDEYDAGKTAGELWDNPRRWALLDWLIERTK